MFEWVRVFVAVSAVAPVLSECCSAGSRCKQAAPHRRVVGLNRGADSVSFGIVVVV